MLSKSKILALTLFISSPFISSASATLLPENLSKTRSAAAQGMVLLKNQPTGEHKALPLQAGERVLLLGNKSFSANSMFVGYQKSGGGSGDVYGSPVIDIYNGLLNLHNAQRIVLDQQTAPIYKQQLTLNPLIATEKTFSDADIQKLRKNNDTVILTIGRNSAELFDHHAVKGDYYLSDNEIKLLKQIEAAKFKKFVVLLNIGTQMDLTWLDHYGIDAALITWFPGAQGGNAIADILIGDVNPSAKLTSSFAKSYLAYPSSNSYHESADYVNYYEDIFVGYRYFETFNKQHLVQYPFGFGLSYTSFALDPATVETDAENINIQVKVHNTGKTAGREVIQVYYRAPQGKLGKAKLALAAFAKTSNLPAGAAENVNLSFKINDMQSYDDTGLLAKSAYILEAGDYEILLGTSSADARERGAIDTYHVAKTMINEQLSTQVAPNLLPKRLRADGSYEPLFGKAASLAANSIKIEAEDFASKHFLVGTEQFDSGKSISNMADFVNTWVSYQVDIPQTATYDLQFRAANGFREIKDMLDVEIDGKLAKNIMLDMPQTGDGRFKNEWHNYIDSAKVKLQLKSGKHTITFKSKNNGFANIDYFSLTPAFDYLALEDSTNSSVSPNKQYSLSDVYQNKISLDAFVQQLSNDELIELLGGKFGTLDGNTGGIGGNQKYAIPAAQTADGPAGIRLSSGGTAWPVAVLLAASWDVQLMRDFATATAREALHNKVDIWLTPGMNIQRDPLAGRNFEYYSEDPWLTAKMAQAVVEAAQQQGVLVTVKHFIGNEKEGNRNSSDSRISERALREIYLKPFEYVIKNSAPKALMTSYNYVNGYETATNYELLSNILRREWGYQGVVMTDWFNQSSASAEVFAGNDIKMPLGDPLNLRANLNKGIGRQHLITSGKRLMRMLMQTPIFLNAQQPSTKPRTSL